MKLSLEVDKLIRHQTDRFRIGVRNDCSGLYEILRLRL